MINKKMKETLIYLLALKLVNVLTIETIDFSIVTCIELIYWFILRWIRYAMEPGQVGSLDR